MMAMVIDTKRQPVIADIDRLAVQGHSAVYTDIDVRSPIRIVRERSVALVCTVFVQMSY